MKKLLLFGVILIAFVAGFYAHVFNNNDASASYEWWTHGSCQTYMWLVWIDGDTVKASLKTPEPGWRITRAEKLSESDAVITASREKGS